MDDDAAAAAPLVLWLNGGPGCSSLKGALQEIGQLVVNRDSEAGGNATLARNPRAWTKRAHVVFFESPPGTGFSYCAACVNQTAAAAAGGGGDCLCAANDTTAALDNYDALVAMLERFPQFKGRDFFVTGTPFALVVVVVVVVAVPDCSG